MIGVNEIFISDRWLADILKCETYIIKADNAFFHNVRNKKSVEYSTFERITSKPVFIYARISSIFSDTAEQLRDLGFYLTEINVIFEKELKPLENRTLHHETRFAIADDERHVMEIARSSFTYSRFYVDKAIKRSTADTIKAEWVRSFFKGRRGDDMIVAVKNNIVIGFLLLLKKDKNTISIDLIAVDAEHRRHGVAEDMINYLQNSYKDENRLIVGTQVNNIASVRLYEKMGFELKETNYMFHYHNSKEKI